MEIFYTISHFEIDVVSPTIQAIFPTLFDDINDFFEPQPSFFKSEDFIIDPLALDSLAAEKLAVMGLWSEL